MTEYRVRKDREFVGGGIPDAPGGESRKGFSLGRSCHKTCFVTDVG